MSGRTKKNFKPFSQVQKKGPYRRVTAHLWLRNSPSRSSHIKATLLSLKPVLTLGYEWEMKAKSEALKKRYQELMANG